MAGSDEIKTEIDLKPLGSGAKPAEAPKASAPATTTSETGKVKIVSKRRRVKLAPPPKKMDVEVAVYGENNFYAGFDNKIANGGLFISSLETLPAGHELDLEIDLEGSKIKTRARVEFIRLDNFSNSECTAGAGLKLLSITPQHATEIERFFSRRAPMFYVKA